MENNELLQKIVNKDEAAFESFLHNNIKFFYKTASKVIVPIAAHEDIMDCLLESLSYIWFHIHLYDFERYPFRTWCCLIIICRAQNKYVSIQRYNKKIDRILAMQRTQLSFVPSAETTYFKEEAYKNTIKKILLLPQPLRDIFIYRYIFDLKPKQIAPRVNMTAKQIDLHLRRAKRLLKKEMNDYETGEI